jgi:hypothetical protein
MLMVLLYLLVHDGARQVLLVVVSIRPQLLVLVLVMLWFVLLLHVLVMAGGRLLVLVPAVGGLQLVVSGGDVAASRGGIVAYVGLGWRLATFACFVDVGLRKVLLLQLHALVCSRSQLLVVSMVVLLVL